MIHMVELLNYFRFLLAWAPTNHNTGFPPVPAVFMIFLYNIFMLLLGPTCICMVLDNRRWLPNPLLRQQDRK